MCRKTNSSFKWYVTTETLGLYYDDTSGEIRKGAVQAGTIGSLQQVLAVGNTGGTIDVTEVETTSIFVENSLNFVFPQGGQTAMTTSAIPYNTLMYHYICILYFTVIHCDVLKLQFIVMRFAVL